MLYQNNPLAFLYDRACLCLCSVLSFSGLMQFAQFESVLAYTPETPWMLYSLIGAGQVIALTFLAKHAQLHLFQKSGLFSVGIVGGLIAIAYIFIISSTENIALHLVTTTYAYIFTILLTTGVLALGIWVLKPKLTPVSCDQDKLKAWLEADDENTLDLSAWRADQANRIAGLITSPRCNRGLVIYGEYGSGKTTLIREVQNKLPDKDWIVINFSAWGKDEIVNLLLKDIIKGISKRIETHLVKSLPAEFVKALGQPSPSQNLTDLLLSSMQPTNDHIEILRRLNGLLEAQNKYCLVVIEDVDRGKHAIDNLNVLSALFDMLAESQRLKYIFTLEDKVKHAVPLTKLLNFREHLSDIQPLLVILTFIDLCRSEANKKGVILTDEVFSEGSLLISNENPIDLENKFNKTIYIHLAEALGNPRDLVQTLKQAWCRWLNIMGEVNIIDVIVYTAIFNNSEDKEAQDIISNYGDYREDGLTAKDHKSFLLKKFPNNDTLVALMVYMLVGRPKDRHKFQTIQLLNDYSGDLYFYQVKDQMRNGQASITQEKLKTVQSFWKRNGAHTPQDSKEVFDKCVEIQDSYTAYLCTQDISQYQKNHIYLLEGLFLYICRNENPLESYSLSQYEHQIYPLSFYLGISDQVISSTVIKWVDSLNKLCVNDKARWVLIFAYRHVLELGSFRFNDELKKKLSDSIRSLIQNIDFVYLLELPGNKKWDLIIEYRENWSAHKDLKTITKQGPLALWRCFINLVSPDIFRTHIDTNWKASLCNKLHFNNSDLQELLENLQIKKYLNSNGVLGAEIQTLLTEALDKAEEGHSTDLKQSIIRIQGMLNETTLNKVD